MTTTVEIKSFAHGIHPPESKDLTKDLAIHQFPFAPVMVILLSQHLGAPAKATVREGQEVVRGQKIGEPDGFMSVAMHAPASGVVERISTAPNSAGKMVPPALFLILARTAAPWCVEKRKAKAKCSAVFIMHGRSTSKVN